MLARRLTAYAPLLILALAWEGMSRSGLISNYALPPLSRVLAAWWGLLHDPDSYGHAAVSLWRGATGLAAAAVLGVTLGTLMAWFRPVNALVGPIVQMFYPMPKSALIPLTILWFGIGHLSKIFLIFLGCLLPIVISTYNGVRGVDRGLLWSAASLGAGRWTIMRDVA
ncbi:MAG: ABC transporter permease subunit, partial [Alphaproteobacteria bacterium]|nr:ABC transporter permease subunit [Alphaproteobacteria bacterium]